LLFTLVFAVVCSFRCLLPVCLSVVALALRLTVNLVL